MSSHRRSLQVRLGASEQVELIEHVLIGGHEVVQVAPNRAFGEPGIREFCAIVGVPYGRPKPPLTVRMGLPDQVLGLAMDDMDDTAVVLMHPRFTANPDCLGVLCALLGLDYTTSGHRNGTQPKLRPAGS